MRRILIIRLSAIGDVAMLIPILYGVCRSNLDCRFTLLTQPMLTSLLIDAPDNLEAMVIDIKRGEKNFLGLLKFAYRVRQEQFDTIIDLHNVIRTKVIYFLSRVFSHTTYTKIDKHRKDRKQLILEKQITDLPSMPSLYKQTLSNVDINMDFEVKPIIISPDKLSNIKTFIDLNISNFNIVTNIGLAPFASKKSKSVNIDIIKDIVKNLINNTDSNIIIFGASINDDDNTKQLLSISDRIISIDGRLDLMQEIALISKLNCMISMDSANMHFASMVGVPVVSLWSGTVPQAGFLGLFQKKCDTIVAKNIDCSPCSIFGTNTCKREDFICCSSINADEVVLKVKNYLN